jgi:hypothetical protein
VIKTRATQRPVDPAYPRAFSINTSGRSHPAALRRPRHASLALGLAALDQYVGTIPRRRAAAASGIRDMRTAVG